ncbi:hypothetical protein KP509_20G036700 [Ceratopteris richardii]|uniref:PDEase domain-containing protein n=1 Tax=Ceratopteris richardii TaxID=49495 RepID=A0A8T2SIC0_CERRI|nr:hypothetical protein KP509_20G036700 [Ceratopteris richardii]
MEEKEALKSISATSKDLHDVLKGIKSWSFDIFEIKREDLPKLVERIFVDMGLFEALPLDARKFFGFVTSIMGQYHINVPYHNFRHACDVLHAAYLILTLVEAQNMLNTLEIFALLLAALCHDVDHPGLTNSFLSVTNDPLAIRYNDISILESHHASTTIKTLLAYESTNILELFSEAEQRHIRKLLVEIILATDMEQHFKIMDMLKARSTESRPFECSPPFARKSSQNNSGSSSEGGSSSSQNSNSSNSVQSSPSSTRDAVLLLKMIIKCADISNVVKPFFLSKRWAALLLTEWFRQGDSERKLGLPVSKNMDSANPVALQ